jgi:hypothetical protein
MIDIISYIIAKAEVKDWSIIVSNSESVNIELSQLDLTDRNEFLYITLPTISRGKTGQLYNGELTYRLEMMLGRKYENETYSSNSETILEKYNNRIHSLSIQLNEFISELFDCANNMEELGNTELTTATNVFAASVDVVNAKLTIKTWE